jgi:hypothetical protein
MPRTAKPRRGRPPLPNARTRHVLVRLTEQEYAAIADAVARENAELAVDDPDDPPATMASWCRDHALDPLGLAEHRGDSD